MGFGLVGTILVIALVVYLLGWRPQDGNSPFSNRSMKQSPREILEERYARGEISRDEFEQMKNDLA